jgi:ligand-binding sensor domain-containing protein
MRRIARRSTARNTALAGAFTAVFIAVFLAACAAVGPGGSTGGSNSFGRRDELRVIGSFADVRAVGVSRRYVYTATGSGIGVYDRLFNAWLPPLARDGGLSEQQITFMTGDPVEDAVWLGVPGGLIMYRPQNEQVQRTIITGIPELIVFDRALNGDVYVRASGQWNRVSRTGMATAISGPPSADKLIVPATLNDVYQRFPGLRSGAPLLFRAQQSDRPLRPYPVMSGSLSLDQPNDVWLGTNGDGLYKVDATLQQATPVRFGLIERGVGALARAADGVWAAGLGASALRGGLSFASDDLQRWRWIDGTIAVPMIGMRATSMALREQRAWIGTDRGLVRARLDSREEMAVWTSLDGLPDDRVFAVSARADGAWVGTARGLVFVSDTTDLRNPRTRGIGTRVLENTPVYALQQIGDTLWIGTATGLVAMLPNGVLTRPVGADPALRRRITALAWSDSVLLAAGDDGVIRLAPRGGVEPVRLPSLDIAQVGQVTRVAIDERTIVMVGTDGVVIAGRAGGIRVLRAGSDVPGPVLDVVLSREFMWLGTPEGIVRLRRASDGGVL